MKAGALDLAGRCPSRGTICGDVACLPRPPQRTGDRCATPEKSACARDGAGPVEDMRRISVEMLPPRADRPGSVARPIVDADPGPPQFRPPCHLPTRPFGPPPD